MPLTTYVFARSGRAAEGRRSPKRLLRGGHIFRGSEDHVGPLKLITGRLQHPLTRPRGVTMKGRLSGNGGGPTPRTRCRRALDAATARIFKMPQGHHHYVLSQAVRVPMRDGVELLADIYAPVTKSLGTLLIRTPYGRTGLIALLTARYYATHGYHVVNQSCRGTFGSGGDFQPFRPDIDDGADTVAWLRRQSWFGGRFALCGASYLGYTAWALMMDPPPELAAAVIALARTTTTGWHTAPEHSHSNRS
jgi:predicted acyl esterase